MANSDPNNPHPSPGFARVLRLRRRSRRTGATYRHRKKLRSWRFSGHGQAWRTHRYLPHLITLLGTSVGLLGLFQALNERWDFALLCLIAAGMLDMFDGKVARALSRNNDHRRFGMELDSLSDVVVFGCVPAVVMYLWGTHPIGQWGWIACTYFVVCTVLRLARFNTLEAVIDIENDLPPQRDPRFFRGVPSPAAAACLLLPIAVTHQWKTLPQEIFYQDTMVSFTLKVGLIAWCMIVPSMMVLPIPTFAPKGWKVPPPYHAAVFVLIAFAMAAAVSFPWTVGIAIMAIYVLSIPMAWLTHRRIHGKAPAASVPPPSIA